MDRAMLTTFTFLAILFFQGANSAVFTIQNKCAYTVWPGTAPSHNLQPLPKTGFELAKGGSVSLEVNGTWSGSFWARTNCSTDSTGKFSCLTGDCGTGKVDCNGTTGVGPATHVEFSLEGINSNDQYVISLVDGFNVPVSVTPQRISDCKAITCAADINSKCPAELKAKAKDGSVVGCKSSCLAFGTQEQCCKMKVSPSCQPTSYSEFFHTVCPDAYSLPYDDDDTTFMCKFTNYTITFCPQI